jgi:glycerol transport system ATP-binding protein
VVQVGTPVELFERPRHTFVGHFIGSPGMNILPCELDNGIARFAGLPVPTANPARLAAGGKRSEIGVRPEFVRFADDGIPVRVVRVSDAGRHQVVETRHGETVIRVLLDEQDAVPAERAHLAFDPAFTRVYVDGWLAGEAA